MALPYFVWFSGGEQASLIRAALRMCPSPPQIEEAPIAWTSHTPFENEAHVVSEQQHSTTQQIGRCPPKSAGRAT